MQRFAECFGLTEREQEVLQILLLSDDGMQEIADSLFVSRAMLYRHVAALNEKTGTMRSFAIYVGENHGDATNKADWTWRPLVGDTAKGAKYSFEDGKLAILQEGAIKKMVSHVGQLSFNGPAARKKGQRVVVVTERAVFELRPEGVTLVEIAPGIDLQTQVLDQMEFMPKIAPDLKLMDSRIFREEKMGLADDK